MHSQNSIVFLKIIVKTSIIEGMDSHTRISWNILVNSKISIWYEKPQFRSVLWQTLNKDEREFYRSVISPNGVMKEDDYWKGLYSNPDVYQKALKALYDTFPSPDKLVSEIENLWNEKARIRNLIFEPVIDEVYKVNVVKILDFGAVVEFVPGKEALLHVSEIAWERVDKVTDYINLGDQIEVKYLGIDKRTRKQKISRKVLLEKK